MCDKFGILQSETDEFRFACECVVNSETDRDKEERCFCRGAKNNV